MKKLFVFVLFIFLISNCTKPEDPYVSFKLSCEKSENWKNAEFHIFTVYFDNGSKGNTEAINIDIDFDLSNKESVELIKTQLWPSSLNGAKPQINHLQLTDYQNNSFIIDIPYINLIPFEEALLLEEDNNYSVEFQINFDTAIKFNSGEFFIDFNNVKTITEKL